MTFLRKRISQAMFGVLMATGLTAVTAEANTLVRMDTTFGSLTIELYDDETPISVENFMHYVEQGAYARGVVQRLDTGDNVIQGGMVRYLGDCIDDILQPDCSTDWVETIDPIKNESGIANTRGTLAYARTANVDSATSEWFINIEDNPSFDDLVDEESGEAIQGYAVFGQVLGDGMEVVDRIRELEVTGVSDMFGTFPLRDIGHGPLEPNLVMYNIHEVGRYTSALNVFEHQSRRFSVTVDIYGQGPYSMQMVMAVDQAQPIFEVDPDTLITLAITPEGAGGFGHEADPAILHVPVIEVNDHGRVYEMRNAVFRLLDDASLRFQLISHE